MLESLRLLLLALEQSLLMLGQWLALGQARAGQYLALEEEQEQEQDQVLLLSLSPVYCASQSVIVDCDCRLVFVPTQHEETRQREF
jgi:hypothetical protein